MGDFVVTPTRPSTLSGAARDRPVSKGHIRPRVSLFEHPAHTHIMSDYVPPSYDPVPAERQPAPGASQESAIEIPGVCACVCFACLLSC